MVYSPDTLYFRSSHRKCSVGKGVLRNFAKFTGKHLCQSLFFNKIASLRPATLLRKRLWHRCFPVNFVKFLRTPFIRNTSGDCFFYFLHVYNSNGWHFKCLTHIQTSGRLCLRHTGKELLWYFWILLILLS